MNSSGDRTRTKFFRPGEGKLLKILHCIASIDPAAGGPPESVRQLCRISQSAGYAVEVASLDSCRAAASISYPAPVRAYGPGLGLYHYNHGAQRKINGHLAGFDLLVINGIWQYNALCGYRAAMANQVPYCVFPHGMLDPYFKHAFPLKHVKKSIYWQLFLRRILNEAEAVMFTCEQERLLARESFSGYHPHEVVVPYGIFPPAIDFDQARTDFLARWPELAGKRLLLFLGRIHPKKGVDLLLKAFAASLGQDKDWHLIVAGPDSDHQRRELDPLAARLNLAGRLTWTGMLEGEQKWGAYRAAELFTLPSHQENFGISVVEAMVAGTPVAITDKVNIFREIEAGNAGLIGTDTVESNAQLFSRWADLTEPERKAMSASAVACFHRNFNYTQTSRLMLQAFWNASQRIGH